MPRNWRGKINLKTVWGPVEIKAPDRITAEDLKAIAKVIGVEMGRLSGITGAAEMERHWEHFAKKDLPSLHEFNRLMTMTYDWGDANSVWIETF